MTDEARIDRTEPVFRVEPVSLEPRPTWSTGTTDGKENDEW